MNTFPPPPPPAVSTPAPRKRRLGLIIGVALGVLAIGGIAVGATLATSDDADAIPPTTTRPAPQMVSVTYTLSVGGEWCADVENTADDNWGYDDVPGMEFQVRDENDKVIGHGALSREGVDTDEACDFTATVKVPKAMLYQVGNPDRGYVTWDQADVRNGRLDAAASL